MLLTRRLLVCFESGGYAFFGAKAKKRLGLSTMIACSISSFTPAWRSTPTRCHQSVEGLGFCSIKGVGWNLGERPANINVTPLLG